MGGRDFQTAVPWIPGSRSKLFLGFLPEPFSIATKIVKALLRIISLSFSPASPPLRIPTSCPSSRTRHLPYLPGLSPPVLPDLIFHPWLTRKLFYLSGNLGLSWMGMLYTFLPEPRMVAKRFCLVTLIIKLIKQVMFLLSMYSLSNRKRTLMEIFTRNPTIVSLLPLTL